MPYTQEELEAIAALIEFYRITNKKSYICKCGIPLKHKTEFINTYKNKISGLKKYTPSYNTKCNKTANIMNFYE